MSDTGIIDLTCDDESDGEEQVSVVSQNELSKTAPIKVESISGFAYERINKVKQNKLRTDFDATIDNILQKQANSENEFKLKIADLEEQLNTYKNIIIKQETNAQNEEASLEVKLNEYEAKIEDFKRRLKEKDDELNNVKNDIIELLKLKSENNQKRLEELEKNSKERQIEIDEMSRYLNDKRLGLEAKDKMVEELTEKLTSDYKKQLHVHYRDFKHGLKQYANDLSLVNNAALQSISSDPAQRENSEIVLVNNPPKRPRSKSKTSLQMSPTSSTTSHDNQVSSSTKKLRANSISSTAS